MGEIKWLPIPGYEGLYEASSDGRIMSLHRFNPRGQAVGGFTLSAYEDNHGYKKVNLHLMGKRSNRPIHRLVMLAFVGPCPAGHEVLHSDGARTNNRLSNLSYGTRSDNVQDSLRHGTNVNAAKTHCKHGHAFTEANTYRRGTGRHCRKCTDMRRARYQARKVMAAA